MTEPDPTPVPRDGAPAPLVVAASLAAVEGVLVVLLGLAELLAVSQTRLAMGVSTAVFFVAYGAVLVFCAWAVTRLRAWARGPILLAQLIQLGVAWSFRGGSSTPVAVALAVTAVVALAGVLHPASIRALSDPDSP